MVTYDRSCSPDPFEVRYAEQRQQWFVVSFFGNLAHDDDGYAAFFDDESEAHRFAKELCQRWWADNQAQVQQSAKGVGRS
jgi:hypothetical protein